MVMVMEMVMGKVNIKVNVRGKFMVNVRGKVNIKVNVNIKIVIMTEYSAANLIFETAKITSVGIGFIAIAKIGIDADTAKLKIKELSEGLNNKQKELIESKGWKL
jgi:hypothetical protein